MRVTIFAFAFVTVVSSVLATSRAESPTRLASVLKQQAAHGDPDAQAKIGWMYSTGNGVPQNDRLAATWYRRAASDGHPGAQFSLGLLYNKGQGVRRNLVLAHMWLNLAGAQSEGDNRAFIVRIRDSVASNMTPGQLATAQRLAEEWHEAHGARVVGLPK